jgi:hypothetical protein
MAIAYSYPTGTPKLQDLLIGTEMPSQPGEGAPKSKTFTINSIIELINPANDANVVHKTGNETIDGVKSFNSTPKFNSGSINIFDDPASGYASINIADSSFLIKDSSNNSQFYIETGFGFAVYKTNTIAANFVVARLTQSRNYTLPNTSGLIALDGDLVHKTGNETIDGIKTFNKDLLVNGITIGKGNGNILSNTVVGNSSLLGNLTGNQNTAIGYLTLLANEANDNTAVGFNAMQLNGVGNTNTSVGSESLSSNLGGSENSAFGYRALYLAESANKNNAFGRHALGNIFTGGQNIGIGVNSGLLTSTSSANISSSFSVYIGNDTKSFANNSQNEIVIGYNATGIGSNSVVLGNSSIINTILRGQTLIGTTEVGTPTFGSTPKLVAADITGGVIDLRSLSTNIVANSLLGRIQFTGKDDSSIGYTSSAIEGISSGSAGTGSGGGGILKFLTADNITGSSPIERMRITNTGILQPGIDNSYSLGASGIRWSSVWAANGTIQTSDEREKKDIIDSDLGLDFISKLRPVSFKWKVGKNEVTSELDGLDEEGNTKTKTIVTPVEGKRTHYGLIAQEVEALLDGKDFGGFIHDKETDIKGLRYDQFIPVLINAIKELKAEIELLKNS